MKCYSVGGHTALLSAQNYSLKFEVIEKNIIIPHVKEEEGSSHRRECSAEHSNQCTPQGMTHPLHKYCSHLMVH